MITSKLNTTRFYLTFCFVVLLYMALAFLTIWTAFQDESIFKQALAVIISLGISIYLFYFIKQSFKNLIKIEIDNHNIAFNGVPYSLRDIKQVDYTGKQNIGKYFLRIAHGEGAQIHFRDGTKKIILDNSYSNTHEIKFFLQNALKKKAAARHESIKFNKEEVLSLPYTKYKGYQLLSFEGFYIWPFLFLLFWAIYNEPGPVTLNFIIYGLITLLWFMFGSFLLHYFRLAEGYLVIRNHNLLWRKHIYPISEIREVVFETPTSHRLNTSMLRVITKDFKTKVYPAGSLTSKTWLKLKKDFEKQGIRVRNECINENK